MSRTFFKINSPQNITIFLQQRNIKAFSQIIWQFFYKNIPVTWTSGSRLEYTFVSSWSWDLEPCSCSVKLSVYSGYTSSSGNCSGSKDPVLSVSWFSEPGSVQSKQTVNQRTPKKIFFILLYSRIKWLSIVCHA